MYKNLIFFQVLQCFKVFLCGLITQCHCSLCVKAEVSTVVDLGYKKLSSTFRLCKTLHSEADYRHFLSWLRNVFTTLAMMDYPYPTDFLAPLPAHPVNVSRLCLLNITYM